MLKNIHRILIIKLQAIGDVVMSTAVIPNVRQAFPDAAIDFLTMKYCAPAVDGHPDIREVIWIQPKGAHRLQSLAGIRATYHYLKRLMTARYDLVFDLYGNARSAFLTTVTGSRYRVGFDFRGRRHFYTHQVVHRSNDVHEVEFNLDALIRVGIPIVSKDLFFPLADSDLAYIDAYLKSSGLERSLLVGINGCASYKAKSWPLEKYASLADRLVGQFGATIVCVWGPGEKSIAESICRQMKQPGIVAPATTLKQLGALLKRCRMVVSNDTSPMHIAAAVGTPTVGIFGPTKPHLQGPWGPQHETVQKKELPCLGCRKTNCEDLQCMEKLSVDEVWERVLACMAKNRIQPADFS
ncbi:MAG: glycosyltransferase family 9 protein [Candidatus Zhuqueibacterota bacterium]